MKPGEIPDCIEFAPKPGFRENALELCRELLKWGKVHNLTGHRDLESAWEDLILDALALANMLKGENLLDIGSGAGFPGIPLALANEDIEVTLLEPRAKRISFQKHIVRKLGLEKRVFPVMGMAGDEKLGGEKFETIVLRAVTGIEKSLELARPYLGTGGLILLPRGAKDWKEAREMGLETRSYRTSPGSPERLAVLAQVSRETF